MKTLGERLQAGANIAREDFNAVVDTASKAFDSNIAGPNKNKVIQGQDRGTSAAAENNASGSGSVGAKDGRRSK